MSFVRIISYVLPICILGAGRVTQVQNWVTKALNFSFCMESNILIYQIGEASTGLTKLSERHVQFRFNIIPTFKAFGSEYCFS